MYRDKFKFEAYHHLFPLLKKYDDKFHRYLRMSYSAFKYIFKEVQSQLIKAWCNLHNLPILPEEQLVMTLRYAFEQFRLDIMFLHDKLTNRWKCKCRDWPMFNFSRNFILKREQIIIKISIKIISSLFFLLKYLLFNLKDD